MASEFRQQAYISEVRVLNQQIFDGIQALKAKQAEATALDYANTLADGDNANTGITADEVIAVVFTTADALEALLGQGHGTNMAKLL